MFNPAMYITCPTSDKLCFDEKIIPTGLFFMNKLERDEKNILNGSVPNSFRLLTYLLARNQIVFEVQLIVNELLGKREIGELADFIPLIFEHDLKDITRDIQILIEELVEEGYLGYVFTR